MIKKISIVLIMFLLFISIQLNIYSGSVEYIGKPEGLISIKEEFFGEFTGVLPGDVLKDSIDIKNTTYNEVEIFFKAAGDDEKSNQLTSELNLNIVLEHNGTSQVIYDGKLYSQELNEYISLGKYAKGYNGKLYFTISVPTSLDNKFANMEAKYKWIFMVIDKEDASEEQEYSEIYENGGEIQEKIGKPYTKNSKTGDNIIKYIISLLLSFVIIIIIIIIKIKNSKNNKKTENKE